MTSLRALLFGNQGLAAASLMHCMALCPVCKSEFRPRRSWQKYDKNSCRQIAYLRRITVRPKVGKNPHGQALAKIRWQKNDS
jgi:hypothetical protein